MDRAFPHLWFYMLRFLITLAIAFPVGFFLAWAFRKLMGASVLVLKIILTAVFLMTPPLLAPLVEESNLVVFNFVAFGTAVGLSLGLFGEGPMGQ